MDEVGEHFERWRYNCSLAEEFRAKLAAFQDWEIVVRFYAALHITSAYLVSKDERFHAAKHRDRIEAIRKCPELMKNNKFLQAYRMLQDVSEQVRYEPGFFASTEDLQRARANLDFVVSMLRAKVERVLGPSGYAQ